MISLINKFKDKIKAEDVNVRIVNEAINNNSKLDVSKVDHLKRHCKII